MKTKLHVALYALVGFMLFSTGCSEEQLIDEVTSQKVERFELTVNQAAPEPSSRIALEGDGITTMWEPGDKLALVEKSRKNPPIYLTTTITQKAPTASFVASSGVPAGDYFVIYNYNDQLAYTHQGQMTINEINSRDKLVLWGELSISEGVSKASISLKHLYAKVKVELQNCSDDYFERIGIYSTKKGFPFCAYFSDKGLVEAHLNNDTKQFEPFTDRRHHLVLFGEDGMINPGNLNERSVLLLPADLRNEDILFYFAGKGKYYEFNKQNINFRAGVSYKVVLDFNQAKVINN